MGGISRTDVENIVSKLTDGGKKITLEQANMLTALVEGLSKVGTATGESVECARLINDINAVPKFGNDITSVDLMAKEVALTYCKEVEKHKNPRNGSFQPGLYPVSANVPMGSQTGATPDGRKAGEPLADGVSPISGRDVNGPTAAANSVAMLDHSIASNGTLFNQKFHPSALSGQSGLEKLSALVRGFFDQKGMHVQYNVVGRETLLEAQKNPEAYKNLVVRVAGYSAHFVALDKTLQDDIIARTEQVF